MPRGICSGCGNGLQSFAHEAACGRPVKRRIPVILGQRVSPAVKGVKTGYRTPVDVSQLPMAERVWYRNRRLYPELAPSGV